LPNYFVLPFAKVAIKRATRVVTMAQPTYQNLLDENQRLREENRQLRLRVDTLEAQVRKLTALLEQAQRTGKRQAAPFSKGTPKQDPKTPGRKPGDPYGPKAHRPLPEQKPDEIIDVPLPRECPDCGGLAEEDHVDQQFQVEIPRQPIVRRFDIHVGRCRRCGRRLQPRHPLQTSEAIGAAASQLGPDLQALIALMKDKYGLSYGDIQGLLDEAFGISVSRGGAAQVFFGSPNAMNPPTR
jgi:transposase